MEHYNEEDFYTMFDSDEQDEENQRIEDRAMEIEN